MPCMVTKCGRNDSALYLSAPETRDFSRGGGSGCSNYVPKAKHV